MTKKDMYPFILILIAACCGSVFASRPNIIYINADDLGIMDVGYTSTRYHTPNIIRLALDGIHFTEAYAPAANCAPSRACVFSGQYSPRHGVYTVGNSDRGKSKDRKLIPIENTECLKPENVTISQALQEGGYKTIHLGKWHLSEDPTQFGFDVNIGGDTSGIPSGGGYFSPFTSGPMQPFSDGYPTGTHRADIFADQAIKFMRIHQGSPFFIHLSYYSVHTKLEPVPELMKRYHGRKDINVDYATMIEKMDQSIGKILDAVDQLGIKDNTMVVFTSDNGGIKKISTQSPYRSGKGSYFDGGIRVPLVVRWPAVITEQSACAIPAIGIDLYPTFLEAAELELPEGKVLDGESLMPILRDEGEFPDRPLFWHFPIYLQKYAGAKDGAHDVLFRTRPGSAIRMGHWKLHEYFEDGRLELYDLSGDPSEWNNLAAIHSRKTAEMHQVLKEWREEIRAPVPTELNPDYNLPDSEK